MRGLCQGQSPVYLWLVGCTFIRGLTSYIHTHAHAHTRMHLHARTYTHMGTHTHAHAHRQTDGQVQC